MAGFAMGLPGALTNAQNKTTQQANQHGMKYFPVGETITTFTLPLTVIEAVEQNGPSNNTKTMIPIINGAPPVTVSATGEVTLNQVYTNAGELLKGGMMLFTLRGIPVNQTTTNTVTTSNVFAQLITSVNTQLFASMLQYQSMAGPRFTIPNVNIGSKQLERQILYLSMYFQTNDKGYVMGYAVLIYLMTLIIAWECVEASAWFC